MGRGSACGSSGVQSAVLALVNTNDFGQMITAWTAGGVFCGGDCREAENRRCSLLELDLAKLLVFKRTQLAPLAVAVYFALSRSSGEPAHRQFGFRGVCMLAQMRSTCTFSVLRLRTGLLVTHRSRSGGVLL